MGIFVVIRVMVVGRIMVVEKGSLTEVFVGGEIIGGFVAPPRSPRTFEI